MINLVVMFAGGLKNQFAVVLVIVVAISVVFAAARGQSGQLTGDDDGLGTMMRQSVVSNPNVGERGGGGCVKKIEDGSSDQGVYPCRG